MSKRAIMSLATISLLTFVLGIGTYAWFTTSTPTGNAKIHSGRLELQNTGVDGLTFHSHDDNDIWNDNDDQIWRPGEKHHETITITNKGNLPAKIYGVSTFTEGDDKAKEITEGNKGDKINQFLEHMKIEIREESDSDEDVLYAGSLKELYENEDIEIFSSKNPLTIYPKNDQEDKPSEVTLYVELTMDEGAGNDVQDHIYNFGLEFHASQHDAPVTELTK